MQLGFSNQIKKFTKKKQKTEKNTTQPPTTKPKMLGTGALRIVKKLKTQTAAQMIAHFFFLSFSKCAWKHVSTCIFLSPQGKDFRSHGVFFFYFNSFRVQNQSTRHPLPEVSMPYKIFPVLIYFSPSLSRVSGLFFFFVFSGSSVLCSGGSFQILFCPKESPQILS